MLATNEKSTHSDEQRTPTNHSKYSTYLDQLQEDSQNYKILKHILDKGSITSLDAFFDYRITRLSGRIFDLRSMGVPIHAEMISVKHKSGASQRYAKYSIQEEQ